MKNDELRSYIEIFNRETGERDMLITTKKQYVKVYSQMCEFNDVATAIKVWCDLSNCTKKELLRQFTLVELTNTFSTRYFARVYPTKGEHVKK